MQTVLEVLTKSAEYLERKGVASARLDAELLLADGLGYASRLALYMQFDRPLPEAQLTLLRERVKRRGGREPLQHILGHVPFYGLKLKSDKRALVPRHETEDFIEIIAGLLKGSAPKRLVDLGTGSGAIALALKTAFPSAEVTGGDCSPEALALAKENALACGLEAVSFVQGRWFEPCSGLYDLIVSNPPYLSESLWATAEPEVRDYDPKGALVAAEEGLADLLHLLREAPRYLASGGMLALETGDGQHERLSSEASGCGYARAWGQRDVGGRERYFFAMKA